MKPALTQERLKELLHYDPDTGVFTRRVSLNGNTAIAGSRAGSLNGAGYIQIVIDGVNRYAHRLAFLYMTGGVPLEVDHINRDKSDNRWVNLRPATSHENKGNLNLQSNNTSGHRGVAWHKQTGKWRAYGTCRGRTVHLGIFPSPEEAATTAQKWREEHFGIFAAA